MNTKEPETKPATNPFFMTPKHYGFSVPVMQCLFTAAAWGGAFGTIILGLAWFGVPIPAPLKIAVAAFGFVFFATVLITWPKYLERWMWIIEGITEIDLNQDGSIGNPDYLPKSPTLRVTVDNQTGDGDDQRQYHELPYADRMPEMARLVASGLHFTFQNFGAPGRLFTQPEWANLTNTMRALGYIEYKNGRTPNLGYDFTEKGKALLRQLVVEGRRIEQEMLPPTHLHQFAVETPPLPRWERKV